MRKSQTTTKNFFFTLTFLYRKFYNLFENIWENLFYIVTFALQLLYVAGYWKLVIKRNEHVDMLWFCRTCISAQNIWH